MSEHRADFYSEVDEIWEHIKSQDAMIAELFNILEDKKDDKKDDSLDVILNDGTVVDLSTR